MTGLQRLLGVAIVTGSALACVAQEIKVVRGVPFSAQATTESVQVLADGNRIVRKTTALVARDGEGRTWRQQGTGTSVVFINDPAGGVAYVLDPRSHSARRIALSAANNATSPESVEAKRQGSGTDSKSESLGTQTMDGLLAEGTRLTRQISAGLAGNERPLEIVIETWVSSDLQIIVMNRTTDPRLGETVYKLTDIKRVEPERSLFEVPATFTIREEPQAPESLRRK